MNSWWAEDAGQWNIKSDKDYDRDWDSIMAGV